MSFLVEYGLAGLFASALLAATLLPVSSEIVLSALLVAGWPAAALVLVATLGNVLGSVVNYWLGVGGGKLFKDRVEKAPLDRFRRWGTWSLLLAWVPVIGDPLTVAAGVIRVNFWIFLGLVTIGKAGRYLVLAYVVEAVAA